MSAAPLVIIQARMGSTRLPGKVLMDVEGESVLERTVERVRRANRISGVVVATSTAERDLSVVRECERISVPCFRGKEDDVLDRYYQAALAFTASHIVRITSDCPLIDPEILDRVLTEFFEGSFDYASNTLERTYPRGFDVEVISMDALRRVWLEASDAWHREHVTLYVVDHLERFRVKSILASADYSHLRLTVDTPEDLALVRAIYSRLGASGLFGYREIFALTHSDPQIFQLNAHIAQKLSHPQL